jgi:hypothetical protein
MSRGLPWIDVFGKLLNAGTWCRDTCRFLTAVKLAFPDIIVLLESHNKFNFVVESDESELNRCN